MRTINNPPESEWPELVRRPSLKALALDEVVRNILLAIQARGDEAVREYGQQFDKVNLDNLLVPDEEMRQAEARIPRELAKAILVASDNIRRFHSARIPREVTVETMQGVTCWTRVVPLERVGIYIPGGTAPLFSTVLMLGIPAALAGCTEVILCTPPTADGTINPSILFAARVCGIRNVYRVGGAQAIGMMAYGTESVKSVDKILGPGNQYVTKAKELVNQSGVSIDFPAGPSEVLIVADQTANPAFVAADLLSQAEHGVDSQVMLVTLDKELIPVVERELQDQLSTLPRKAIAEQALQNGAIVNFDLPEQALRFTNRYAPEHLIIQTEQPEVLASMVTNAGSVFLGPYSPEAVGDYASGTNHTLPTSGYARTYSGISCSSFVKEITFQQLTREGLRVLEPTVSCMAEAESLEAHRRAVTIRFQS